MDECRNHGIEVVPPDVRISHDEFRVHEGRDRLRSRRRQERRATAPSRRSCRARREAPDASRTSTTFCEAVDLRKVNKKVLESLIMAGALDALGPNRASLLAALEEAMAASASRQKEREAGQMNLLAALGAEEAERVRKKVRTLPEWEPRERLAKEKEVLGFFVSGHPLDALRPTILALPAAERREPQGLRRPLRGAHAGHRHRAQAEDRQQGAHDGLPHRRGLPGQLRGGGLRLGLRAVRGAAGRGRHPRLRRQDEPDGVGRGQAPARPCLHGGRGSGRLARPDAPALRRRLRARLAGGLGARAARTPGHARGLLPSDRHGGRTGGGQEPRPQGGAGALAAGLPAREPRALPLPLRGAALPRENRARRGGGPATAAPLGPGASPRRMPMDCDVLVVGAGAAGLLAAVSRPLAAATSS